MDETLTDDDLVETLDVEPPEDLTSEEAVGWRYGYLAGLRARTTEAG